MIRDPAPQNHSPIGLYGSTCLQQGLFSKAVPPTFIVTVVNRWGIHSHPLIDTFELVRLRPLKGCALIPGHKLDILDRFCSVLFREQTLQTGTGIVGAAKRDLAPPRTPASVRYTLRVSLLKRILDGGVEPVFPRAAQIKSFEIRAPWKRAQSPRIGHPAVVGIVISQMTTLIESAQIVRAVVLRAALFNCLVHTFVQVAHFVQSPLGLCPVSQRVTNVLVSLQAVQRTPVVAEKKVASISPILEVLRLCHQAVVRRVVEYAGSMNVPRGLGHVRATRRGKVG